MDISPGLVGYWIFYGVCVVLALGVTVGRAAYDTWKDRRDRQQ